MKNNKKIYILHGWSYSTEKWEPFVAALQEKNIECVLLKIPGLTAPLNAIWDLDDYVAWLAKTVASEKDKIILLGHSNGGRMSLAFALKYPQRVKQLVLIDSAGIYHNELPIKIKRFIFGILAKAGGSIKNVKPIRRLFYQFIREHDYEKADPNLRQTMQNLIANDLTAELEKVIVPTQIIWGENDTITPLSDGALMQRKIKNAALHMIQEGRHSPQFTHVKKVSDIVVKAIT